MRIFLFILFCTLTTAAVPVYAGDPSQVFSTIIGEIGRQIEQKQKKELLKRLRPLWNACAKGDIAACDRAAAFPNLTNQARSEIARMRHHNAEIRPDFERNFHDCQTSDSAACQKALDYPYLSDTDRRKLQSWKQAAEQHNDALAAFQKMQRDCYAGSLRACNLAISESFADESALIQLGRQRDKLQRQQDERRAREKKRQATVAKFRRHQRSCNAGLIVACDVAIKLSHVDERAREDLKRQRAKLKSVERKRRAQEEWRQAEIRQYNGLREECIEGNRAACQSAARHARVSPADLDLFEKRSRELAPVTERVSNFFAQSNIAVSKSIKTNDALTVALLGVIALLSAVVAILVVKRNRGSAQPPLNELPVLNPKPSQPSVDDSTEHLFQLTGHMPTDIRHAITLANQ